MRHWVQERAASSRFAHISMPFKKLVFFFPIFKRIPNLLFLQFITTYSGFNFKTGINRVDVFTWNANLHTDCAVHHPD